jgi:hypothetical protein
MSCPTHPQWYHDREDCPFCATDAPPTGKPTALLRAELKETGERLLATVPEVVPICLAAMNGIMLGRELNDRVALLEQLLRDHGIEAPHDDD